MNTISIKDSDYSYIEV